MKQIITLILALAHITILNAQIYIEANPLAPFETTFRGAVGASDVDLDGDLDVLLTGGIPNQISSNLYLNDGSGNFELSGIEITDFIDGSVVFGDIDGDKYEDLVMIGKLEAAGPPHSRIFVNDGNGQFTMESDSSFSGTTGGSVQLNDLDYDGDLDIIVNGRDATDNVILEIYLNDGLGNFSLNDNLNLIGNYIGSVKLADFNGDSLIDIMSIGRNDINVNTDPASVFAILYINDGNGQFTELPNININGITGVVDAADIDGDNDIDIFTVGRTADDELEGIFYFNDGTGIFSENPTSNILTYNWFGTATAFFDVEGDGDKDLLITGYDDSFVGQISFYINDGDGNFSLVDNEPFQTASLGTILPIDVDGDLDLDLILGGQNSFNAFLSTLYLNQTGTVSVDDSYFTYTAINSYPNPIIDNQIKLDCSGFSNQQLFITVTDIEGRTIINKFEKLPNSNGIVSFELDNLSNGIYFVMVEDFKKVGFTKIIKQ